MVEQCWLPVWRSWLITKSLHRAVPNASGGGLFALVVGAEVMGKADQ